MKRIVSAVGSSLLVFGLVSCGWLRDEPEDVNGFSTPPPSVMSPMPAGFAGASGVTSMPVAPVGPPRLRQPTCAPASTRPTRAACFNEFARCVEQTDGTFCGELCRSTLDCSRIDCSDYTPPSDILCEQVHQAFEGLCGEIRYRIETEGNDTDIRFWDASSGELLALQRVRDTPFCNGASNTMTFGDAEAAVACVERRVDRQSLCSEEQCGDTLAIRGQDGCDFELLAPLPDPPCDARVLLDGVVLPCDEDGGWAAVDPLRVRLSGSACDAVLSGQPHVRVLIPCIALDP